MKLKLLSLSLFVLMLNVSSCKKDDTNTDPNHDPACSTCEVTTALAENNDLQTGIYKGLLLTGTGIGHFRMNVKNGDDQIFMVMKYTRESNPVLNDSLKPSSSFIPNTGSDINATIIGTASRTTVYLPVNGLNVSVGDFTLSGSIGTGPKPQATALKELSGEQVKVFEGTMQESSASGPNGKVGFVVRGNTIEGILTNSPNTLRESFIHGTVDAGRNFTFSYPGNNSVYTGRFTSDTKIEGSFTINGVAAGTFTASRTL